MDIESPLKSLNRANSLRGVSFGSGRTRPAPHKRVHRPVCQQSRLRPNVKCATPVRPFVASVQSLSRGPLAVMPCFSTDGTGVSGGRHVRACVLCLHAESCHYPWLKAQDSERAPVARIRAKDRTVGRRIHRHSVVRCLCHGSQSRVDAFIGIVLSSVCTTNHRLSAVRSPALSVTIGEQWRRLLGRT